MYNKNGSLKYHFNQYELNLTIYQCFRTGASQSIHNMCGSRNFYQWWGGGVQTRRQENSFDSFFFLFVLCSPQPINRGAPMVLFKRGSIIFQGVQLFFRNGGGGGPNVNFYRNPYITCDFLSPIPPLNPRMHNNFIHTVHPC